MKNRFFNCTQQELYAVCTLGWESCSQHLAKFSSFKPKYTAAFIEAKKAEISETTNMHDSYQRASVTELMRLSLKEQANLCVKAWRKLQLHIQEAWPAEQHKIRLKSAGQAYYSAAYNYSWEACQGLMNSASTFIKANAEVLTAGDNMAPAFVEEFDALYKSFSQAYQQYLDGGKKAGIKTDEKLNANNHLHKELMSMFRDAKAIFSGQAAMEKLFTFEQVLLQVSGPGVAGIKGTVSSSKPFIEVIPGLEVSIVETGAKAALDENGKFQFSQLGAGTYTLWIKALGHQDQRLTVNVNTGTYTTQNILLLESL